jgi:hypothetical protein
VVVVVVVVVAEVVVVVVGGGLLDAEGRNLLHCISSRREVRYPLSSAE